MKAITLAALLVISPGEAAVIYDNSSDFHGTEQTTALEIGDQIQFAGTERLITAFSFECYTQTFGSGAPTARVRFYLNDGPIDPTSSLPTPGTVIYQSPEFSIFTFDGYGVVNIHELQIAVNADSITWAVEFSGVPEGGEASLLDYGPPSIGGSGNFVWERGQNAAWHAVTHAGKSNSLGVRFSAVALPDSNPVIEQQLDFSTKFNFAAIDLTSVSNTLAQLFPDAPAGMVLYKFDNASGYRAFQKYDWGWSQPDATLLSGEGFIVVMPPSTNLNSTLAYQATIRGLPGTNAPPIFVGWNLISGGRLSSTSKLPKPAPQDGDLVFMMDRTSSRYSLSTFNGAAQAWEPPIAAAPGNAAWYFAGSGWPKNPTGAAPSGTAIYVNNFSPAYGSNARFVSAKGVPLTGEAQLYAIGGAGERIPMGAPILLGTNEFAGYTDPRVDLIRYIDSTIIGSANVLLTVDGPDGAGETASISINTSSNPLIPPIGLSGLTFVAKPMPEFLTQPRTVTGTAGGAVELRTVFNYAGEQQPDSSLSTDPNCGMAGGCLVNYQWQKKSGTNWLDVPGARSDTLRLSNLAIADFGIYRLRVFWGARYSALSAEITVGGNAVTLRIRDWTRSGPSIRLGVETTIPTENYYALEVSQDLKTWKRITCPQQVDSFKTGYANFEEAGTPAQLFVRARAAQDAAELRAGSEQLGCEGTP